MKKHRSPTGRAGKHRKSTGVRVLSDDVLSPNRRTFLHLMAFHGVAVPAVYGAVRSKAEAAQLAPEPSPIIREFADPYIEMIRLLREASEVEHALMIQYLYAAFSLKPAYQDVLGYGDPGTRDLLGVAVEEMQHLATVNRLLVDLGAAPNFERQDFPYEPDIYPFEFSLEPLSMESAARYMFTEAPADTFDAANAKSASDRAFLDRVDGALGNNKRPNHVGSFYEVVIETLKEVISTTAGGSQRLPDLAPWIGTLEELKLRGETGHFVFFKQLFMGTHEGFKGHPDVWSLSADDPAYPARKLAVTPSAFVGHPRQIDDPTALGIAWLSNLHYWLVLGFLTYAYRYQAPVFLEFAKWHMSGPMWSLGRHLPTLGVGLPFDSLSMGYTLGKDRMGAWCFFIRMLSEADNLAQRLGQRLPTDYPAAVNRETLAEIETMR